MQPIRIAFGHQARTGKDTACEYLSKTFGGETLRFASGVYDVAGLMQDYFGKDRAKDTHLLQMIGLGLRDVYGSDVWVDRVSRAIEALPPDTNIYIPDVRFPNEADMLRKCGFKIVKLTRRDRPIDRDPNHPSETSLADYPFDLVIENDGTIDDFYRKVYMAVR